KPFKVAAILQVDLALDMPLSNGRLDPLVGLLRNGNGALDVVFRVDIGSAGPLHPAQMAPVGRDAHAWHDFDLPSIGFHLFWSSASTFSLLLWLWRQRCRLPPERSRERASSPSGPGMPHGAKPPRPRCP